jgi:hypothetical protein
MTTFISDRLEVLGAAAIDGELGPPTAGARWVSLELEIRNAEVDEAGEPIAAVPGPPVLTIAGPVEDLGHLLVGLLNTYSQLTGVPIEQWLGVAEVQPSQVTYASWDERHGAGRSTP